MTKADIIEAVQATLRLSKTECAELVESVFETVKSTLASGEDVKITGFGNFMVRSKAARRGRNPRTGEEITIQARKILTFKPSLILRQYVAGKGRKIS
ncbi:MAG: integration host factor subunit alpha [Nitrospirae bacterium GWC2_56_14]|nr:MAG: integration host factor subunit alpha [Nitrospirae bacterium GWC2_56_14]